MEKITKLNDTQVEIERTKLETVTVSLDQLIYDRDSLVRTQENNTQEALDRNQSVQEMIDALNVQIASTKELGVKEASEIEAVVIEPAIEVGIKA